MLFVEVTPPRPRSSGADAAQDWLASQGRTGQWGTDHFSGVPATVDRFTRLATTGTVWTAHLDGRLAGVVIISTTPLEYIDAAPEPEPGRLLAQRVKPEV
ncbi:hypothetical protein [Lentzea sp. NPDC003310]|uniref:hypothetical protein n=1 Tax=Lentzea sp. NPDC003310 TaxID=3154447 RepID=UPI0033A40D5F